jgi:F0F1-type ATP synthase membrane subunit b/b'
MAAAAKIEKAKAEAASLIERAKAEAKKVTRTIPDGLWAGAK